MTLTATVPYTPTASVSAQEWTPTVDVTLLGAYVQMDPTPALVDSTTGVQVQAKGADSVPLALAKGLALVITAGFTPTACVMHPDDWTDALAITIPRAGRSAASSRSP